MENEYDCDDVKMKNYPPTPHVSTIMVSAFHGKRGGGPTLSPFLPVFKFVIVLGVLLLPEVIMGSELSPTVHHCYKQLHRSRSCQGLSL